jgi:translation initiation factor 2 beta subunit (eIF-2beta)/eIF-5
MSVEGVVIELPDKRIRRIQLKKPLCLEEGDVVSVMRHNKEAGRELLEGCGFVSEIKEWNLIKPVDTDIQYRTLPRKVEWIPIERSPFEKTPYNYESMMEGLYEKKTQELGEGGGKLRLKEPMLEKIPKQTVWVNWTQTIESLENGTSRGTDHTVISYSEHLKEWICKELSTEANVNGQGQLIMRGIWKLQAVCNLLRKYIQYYKKCKQCHGTDTKIIEYMKCQKVWCDRCKADSYVDT